MRRVWNSIRRWLGLTATRAAAVPTGLRVLHDQSPLRELLDGMFSPSAGTGIAAVEAIGRKLAGVVADELRAAEEGIRRRWRSGYREPPFFEALLRDPGRPACGVLGLFSFHPSGYVREAAVRRLAAPADGSALRFLLLRLNDWVAEVREAALAAVLDQVREDRAAAFGRDFVLVERALRTERAGLASLAGALAGMLATAEAQTAALAAAEAESRRSARAVVRFLLDRVPGAGKVVVARGMTARDDVIRAWVVPWARRVLPPEEALAVLRRLAADPSVAVRRESLKEMHLAFPGEARPFLERAVLDVSASVREASRLLLKESGIDFRSVYRDAVRTAARARPLAAALAGLAEVGSAPQAQDVAPHLTDPRATVRRAAVQSVMRLAGETFAARVAGLLEDASPAVSAAARNELRQYAPLVGQARLLLASAASPYRHTRLHVVPLLAALPKWQSITCLIHETGAEDEERASLARQYISVWNRQYNRSQRLPSRQEVEDLLAALSAAGPALDKTISDEIRFAVRPFL